jgi:hypothetical protein
MRCPKCGFISFDHLDFCRKCQKPLGSVAVMLHGSAYDCHAPVFLRFSRLIEEDEMERLDDPLISEIEEVEIEAPDLDAMRLNPVPAPSAREKNTPIAPKVAVAAPARTLAATGTATARTLSPPEPPAPAPAAAFFGNLEVDEATDEPEEQPVAFTLSQEGMELPPALADISDLAPPGRDVEFTKVEGEDDLDLNLDLDLGFDLQDIRDMKEDTALPDAKSEPVAAAVAAPPRKSPPGAVDMDSDLDFELDLGGLSLRDYDSGRK